MAASKQTTVKQASANKATPKAKALDAVIGRIVENLDPKVFDDMYFLETVNDMEKGVNPLGVMDIVNMLMSPGDKAELYDNLREKDGRVPIKETTSAILEIMKRTKEGKK